ncbi:hypothetical protein [Enterovibrio sp. 27052020O]|uniref:hypothetical protein n=1 Tax=Enterovibrio sp. 27052020O TaxID=3241166 RepID=UPI00388E4C01
MGFLSWDRTPTEWGIVTLIIGVLALATLPVIDRVMLFADEVEFRYLANAFEGSARNVQMRSALKTENKQSDIVAVDNVSFRLSPSQHAQAGFPFALVQGATTLMAMSSKDCGELLANFTDQSYWLETDTRPGALKRPQPKVRAVVKQDSDNLQPYCRFERPVRTGFWSDGEPDFLDHHVFTYYPVTGRVEVLRENQEQ